MQNLPELVLDWISFKGNEYEEEDEFLLAMEEIMARKKEYGMIEN